MSEVCRKDTRISNEKVTFTGSDKPLECYGYRDDRTPPCIYLNNCRRENGLSAIAFKIKSKPTGRQCKQCAEYDICLKRGGANGVSRACKYFKKGT
jgi:hypothetical protein